MEDAILVGVAQARVQRQDFHAARFPPQRLAEDLRRLADLALARQEHQHVALPTAAQIGHRIGERLLLLLARGVLPVALDRAVAHLHRVEAAGDFDHRRVVEMPREFLRVDGGRSDDDFQVFSFFDQLLQIAEQKIDVQASFVRFIEDDGVVGAQQRVALRLGEQDAVGHQLKDGVRPHPVVEAYLVADQAAELGLQFLGDARRYRACGDAPRLGVADDPARAAGAAARAPAHFQQDLRDLRGLARTGLAANDDDRMRGDRAGDLFAFLVDGERGVESDLRHGPPRI